MRAIASASLKRASASARSRISRIGARSRCSEASDECSEAINRVYKTSGTRRQPSCKRKLYSQEGHCPNCECPGSRLEQVALLLSMTDRAEHSGYARAFGSCRNENILRDRVSLPDGSPRSFRYTDKAHKRERGSVTTVHGFSAALDSRKVDQNRGENERDYYDRNVVALFDFRPPREPWEWVRLHSLMILLGPKCVREWVWSSALSFLCVIPSAAEGPRIFLSARRRTPTTNRAKLLVLACSCRVSGSHHSYGAHFDRAVVGVLLPAS